MSNKIKNYLIAVLGTAFVCSILFYTIKNNNTISYITEMQQSYMNSISTYKDSINIYANKIKILDEEILTLNTSIDSIKKSDKNIIDKYKNKIKSINKLSANEVANYLTNNFEGDSCEILSINSDTLFTITDSTARDIIKKDMECEQQEELYNNSRNEILLKDKLIAKQISIITNKDNIINNQNSLINDLKISCDKYNDKVIELQKDIDRQKLYKIIGFSTTGVLLIALIF